MIHVIAIITAKPGLRGKMLAEIEAVKSLVHAEDGCIEYQPAIDTANLGEFQAKFGDDTFVVIEKWVSLDNLMAHASSEHMARYSANVKNLMASRAVHVLSPAQK